MAGQILGFIFASVIGSIIWFFIVGMSDMGEFKDKSQRIMVVVGIGLIVGFLAWVIFS